MPRVPRPILELARTHQAQLAGLENDARQRVKAELSRALDRIEVDRRFRRFSDFEALQASEIEILAKLTQRETTQGLEVALEEILSEGLLLAPSHAERELMAWTEYYGAEARPLNLAALSKFDRGTLIERIPSSLSTWGPDVARRVRKELSASIATRQFGGRTLDALEGVIGAERWKADRILRTELSDVYNAAHLEGLTNARDAYGLAVKKSAIATFDGRTDPDSYPVHGQVRELEENFVDGDGRRYLHPPGRPNDREKEIPWMEDGPEITPIVEGVDAVEAAQARNAALAGQPPPRTVPRFDVDTFEGRRARALWSWGSGSNSIESVAMKEAVRLEFGLGRQAWNPRGHALPTGDRLSTIRADMGRTYEETQAAFRSQGVGSVRLYRGVRTDVSVGGSIESWTTDPGMAQRFAGAKGRVIVADVDRRRVLASVDSPGWTQGRLGPQSEYIVLSDPPALEFKPGDWQSGPFRAMDLDPQARSAGPWGVLEDSAGRARLEHLPSGQTILEGTEYARADLAEAARYLDRSGFFDGNGNLTAIGRIELPNAVDVMRVRYGANVPAGTDGVRAIELRGDRWGIVNPDFDAGDPDTWSRRTIRVVRETNQGYEFEEFRGVAQRNLAVITEPRGPGDGYFELVHIPTGRSLFQGTRTYYQKGYRVPEDIGGWKQRHLKEFAEGLHEYIDPETGAIISSKAEEFDRLIDELTDTWAIQDDVEVGRIFDRALNPLDDDDEFDPFLDAVMARAQRKGGPGPGAAAAARSSHVKPDAVAVEVDPAEKFENAVVGRMNALRRGRYNRYKDVEFDNAVQAEAARRMDIERARVLKAQAKANEEWESNRVRLDEGRRYERGNFSEISSDATPGEVVATRQAAAAKATDEAEERAAKVAAVDDEGSRLAQELARHDLARLEREKERADSIRSKWAAGETVEDITPESLSASVERFEAETRRKVELVAEMPEPRKREILALRESRRSVEIEVDELERRFETLRTAEKAKQEEWKAARRGGSEEERKGLFLELREIIKERKAIEPKLEPLTEQLADLANGERLALHRAAIEVDDLNTLRPGRPADWIVDQDMWDAPVLNSMSVDELGDGTLGGISDTRIVTLDTGRHTRTRAVFKPIRGDHMGHLRDRGMTGSGADREIIANELDLVLGGDRIVPPTQRKSIDGVPGSFQYFEEDAVSTWAFEAKKGAEAITEEFSRPDSDFQKLSVLDYVMGQQDRHGKNMLLAEKADGSTSIVAIDNGLALSNRANKANERTPLRAMDKAELGGTAEIAKRLSGQGAIEEIGRVMVEQGLDHRATMNGLRRAIYLKNNPRALANAEGGTWDARLRNVALQAAEDSAATDEAFRLVKELYKHDALLTWQEEQLQMALQYKLDGDHAVKSGKDGSAAFKRAEEIEENVRQRFLGNL